MQLTNLWQRQCIWGHLLSDSLPLVDLIIIILFMFHMSYFIDCWNSHLHLPESDSHPDITDLCSFFLISVFFYISLDSTLLVIVRKISLFIKFHLLLTRVKVSYSSAVNCRKTCLIILLGLLVKHYYHNGQGRIILKFMSLSIGNRSEENWNV